jgi:hypothetical protein
MNRSVIRLFFDCFNRADKRYSLILEKGCLGSIPFLIYYAISDDHLMQPLHSLVQ